jgi:hypothetical protein
VHTRDAVARYASRVHRLLDGRHGVASPFGAWLLLALVAPAADGPARGELADVLGCDVDEAFRAATELLARPHAEVVLGSAVWHDARFETDRLRDLVRRLSPPADSGPIPAQADADAWARDRTLGLIDRFPVDLEVGAPLAVLLATAIATKVSWLRPFVRTDPSSAVLPAEPGFAGLPLLRSPGAFWQGFVDTAAGLVAAFAARSQHALVVTSVVGATDADPVDVLDAATAVAVALEAGQPLPTRSLFELPLGDGPAWRITEQSDADADATERYEVLLPAWEAQSELDLTRGRELGFAAAGDVLTALLPSGDYRAEARQSAMARYTRVGFEAAAVTALGVRALALHEAGTGPVRTARIEFTRPHAVVAVTEGEGEWDGLPVFAAWVGQAVPAD